MPAYPADRPNDPDTSALVDRIPGWGVDLDTANRPSVPRELPVEPAPGVHWTVPDDQPERWPRERSNEHAFLPPVFGTSTPATRALRSDSEVRLSSSRRGSARVDTNHTWIDPLIVGGPWVITGALAAVAARRLLRLTRRSRR